MPSLFAHSVGGSNILVRQLNRKSCLSLPYPRKHRASAFPYAADVFERRRSDVTGRVHLAPHTGAQLKELVESGGGLTFGEVINDN